MGIYATSSSYLFGYEICFALVAQQCDQVLQILLASSSSFILKKHIKFQEGKHYWLLPMTSSTTIAKLLMVCLQEGENDVGMTCMDTAISEQHKVSLFICSFSNFENGLLPNKFIVIRNHGEAQELFGERHGWGEYQPERPSQPEAHNILNSSPTWSSGPGCLKNIA